MLDMGATLGGVASGVGGIFGSLIGGAMNRKNVQDTNKMNERLMREGWARDDSKHQRTVEDLRAAGLNPILAAGGGTSNSNPVSMESAKPGEGLGQAASNAGTLAISGYQADTARKLQHWQEIANMIGIDESLARAENIRAQTGSVESQTALNFINELLGAHNLEKGQYDFDIAKDKGQPSTAPMGYGPATLFNSIVNMLQNMKQDRENGTVGSFGWTDFIKTLSGDDSSRPDNSSGTVTPPQKKSFSDYAREQLERQIQRMDDSKWSDNGQKPGVRSNPNFKYGSEPDSSKGQEFKPKYTRRQEARRRGQLK